MLAAGREVVDRLLVLAGLLEVHRQDGRKLADALRIQLLQGLAHPAMKLPPLLLQQRAVRGVLHEPVAEEVLQLRPDGGKPDEALCLERLELGIGGQRSSLIHGAIIARPRR